MPLNNWYTVVLDGVEPWIVGAPDDEQAAWNALSLSKLLGLSLIDVIPYGSKRVPEQLARDT